MPYKSIEKRRAMNRQRQAKRYAAGFCPDCSSPKAKGKSRCETHMAKRRVSPRS